MREYAGQKQTAEPINGEVKLHKQRRPYDHGLTAVPRRCHGDEALDASERQRPSKRSVLIGRAVGLIGEEGGVGSLAKILDGDVIQETAKGVPQSQEVPNRVNSR